MRHGRVHLDQSSKCAKSNTWTWTKLNWKLKSQNPQKTWTVEKTWFPSSHHESLFTTLLCICSSCHEELFYRCLDDIHRRNGTQNFKHLQRPRQTEVSYKSAVAWCKVFMILLHILLAKNSIKSWTLTGHLNKMKHNQIKNCIASRNLRTMFWFLKSKSSFSLTSCWGNSSSSPSFSFAKPSFGMKIKSSCAPKNHAWDELSTTKTTSGMWNCSGLAMCPGTSHLEDLSSHLEGQPLQP